MTVKNISDMTPDERFAAATELEWDLDVDGTLHRQFTSFDRYQAFRQKERLFHVKVLRDRGVTEDEKETYRREYVASTTLQSEFSDCETYCAYRAAEARGLIGTGGL
jgi:hypothetical protein